VNVSAPGYEGTAKGFDLTPTNPRQTGNFALYPAALWSRRGTGDMVFDMPTYIRRVRITGTYTGNSSNFVVYVSGRLLVNELLGRYWGTTTYDGTLTTTGGVTEIKLSSGVSWSFTEVR
jgi:hypothetical protein